MSTKQLQKAIINQVLDTKDNDLLSFILDTFKQNKDSTKKTKSKKKINIGDPEHPYYNKLRPSEIEGVREAMEDYKAGKYTTLSSLEEIENHFRAL